MSISTERDTRRVIFGWPLYAGTRVHAVIDAYRDPADHTVAFELDGEVIEGHSGDPQPWLRFTQTLCGVRGGGTEGIKVTPEHEFGPQGCPTNPHATVCPDCLRIWSARFAPRMPGWTKTCAECQRDLLATSFRSDMRTRDKLATACEDCLRQRREAGQAADRIIAETVRTVRRETRLREAAAADVVALTAWQHAPWLETFTCGAARHVLLAEVDEHVESSVVNKLVVRPGATGPFDLTTVPTEVVRVVIAPQWRCPCGVAPVDPRVVTAAHRLALSDTGGLLGEDLGIVNVRAA